MSFLLFFLFSSFLLANNPVLLVPGLYGSQINYKSSSSSSWAELWNFMNSILNPNSFVKTLQTKYDPDTDIFLNLNDYATEIVGWGTTSGLDHLDNNLASQTYYFHDVISALQNAGYKEGVDLFGAPYDFRLENFNSVVADGGLFPNLKSLIENICSEAGKPVFLVSNGVAASILRHFLAHYVNADWKAANIAGWISSGGGFGGAPVIFHYLISYKTAFIPTLNGQQMHDAEEYFAGLYWNLPTLATFPSDYVLAQVTTSSSSFNITIDNITEGFRRSDGDTAAAAAKSFLDVLNADFDAPNVDLYYYYGTGISTVASEVYSGGSDSNWWQNDGKEVSTDGDGLVTTESATAPEQWAGTTTNVIQGTAIPGADKQSILSNSVFINGMLAVVTGGSWESNPARPLFEVKQSKTRVFLDHARTLELAVRDLVLVTKDRLIKEIQEIKRETQDRLFIRNSLSVVQRVLEERLKAVNDEMHTFVEIYMSAEKCFDTATHAAVLDAEKHALEQPGKEPAAVWELARANLDAMLGTYADEVGARLDVQHAAVVAAVRRAAEEVGAVLKME